MNKYLIQNSRFKIQDSSKGGFVTLLAVLIVGAAAAAVTVSLLILGVGVSKSSFALEESRIARAYAETCSNDALEKIKKNNSFLGTSQLSFEYGTCSYTVTDLGGESRQINSIGTKGVVVRKNKVIISAINPKINISTWQEAADF